jgi:plasmid stabilization system protein ParE
MVEKIKISSVAQNELEDSSEWYEEQSPGLGDYFADVIYRSLNSISKNPEAYHKKRANNREFVVDKFPYIIVYQFLKKENAIYIVHIFHTKRNPKLKYKRR